VTPKGIPVRYSVKLNQFLN